MSEPGRAVPLDQDVHVHSTFSDDARSTLAENIAAARARGVTRLHLVDHVRRSTTWVPELVAAVRREPVPEGLTVVTGVETKVLDARGTLDLPPGRLPVDTVLVADHQFPGPDGPWTPERTRQELADGLAVPDALEMLVGGLVGGLAAATAGAPSAQLAHCFSILPKVGLSEDDLPDDLLAHWAAEAARHDVLVEVNEKWACPGPRVLRAAVAAGVRLAPATDSHHADDVGRYARVPELLVAAGLVTAGRPTAARPVAERGPS